jgi:transcription-repair coupling factor (superfamily II helicase)
MELPKPMDRLICGDVGFGKTEVAIRAAFKAVMGGKQVALLVPTTVLAQQHYNHFRERMAEYPVRIELMSRFRTAKQQKAVMEAAAVGAVDIVIGTRLAIFTPLPRLAYVIVDEEHDSSFKQINCLSSITVECFSTNCSTLTFVNTFEYPNSDLIKDASNPLPAPST